MQDISGSAVVPAGPAAHKAMLWRPAGDIIGGGNGNTVNAPCAAILGGQGNTVNHAYAGVFGNGVTSQAPDTFHVSCLNAVNTPNVAIGPFAPGTVFWKAGNTLTAADKVLVIQ